MPYYVTTPIYYVNGEPHLGHAYTTIAADVLARHMRQRGEDVFFLTGTDEHGEPVTQAAEKLGITPRELGDRNAVRFKELASRGERHQRLLHPHDGSRAHGGRRGRPAHPRQRARLFGHLRGLVLPALRRLQDRLRARGRQPLPDPQDRARARKEDNWFFRLSAFQEPLEQLYAERPEFVIPRNRYNEALSFIKGAPGHLAQRPRLKWGVPVPWDAAQVIYVWIDALLNYYSALSYAREGEDLTDRFWPATST